MMQKRVIAIGLMLMFFMMIGFAVYHFVYQDWHALKQLNQGHFFELRGAVVNPKLRDDTRIEIIKTLSKQGVIDTEWQHVTDDNIRDALPGLDKANRQFGIIAPKMLLDYMQRQPFVPERFIVIQQQLTEAIFKKNLSTLITLLKEEAEAPWIMLVMHESQLQAYHTHPKHRNVLTKPEFIIKLYPELFKMTEYPHLTSEEYQQYLNLQKHPALLLSLKRLIQVLGYEIKNDKGIKHLSDAWTMLLSSKDNRDVLLPIRYFLKAYDAPVKDFPIQKIFYSKEKKQLYMRKIYSAARDMLPRAPFHKDNNNPVREVAGYFLGKALQSNPAEVIVTQNNEIFSRLTLTTDLETLAQHDEKSAISASLVFNTLCRKPDDGKSLYNRNPAIGTLVFYDHDGCFLPLYHDMDEYLKAIDVFSKMDVSYIGETLSKTDIEMDVVNRTVKLARKVDVDNIIDSTREVIVKSGFKPEGKTVEEELEMIRKFLKKGQMTIEEDVARLVRALPDDSFE